MGNKSSAPSVVDHSASWPDPASIPSPAYLVVGGGLDKEIERRAFYDNPAYYILDNTDPPQDLLSRYIQVDFNAFTFDSKTPGLFDKVNVQYPLKFDIIIFDYSVAKFAFHTTLGLIPVVGRLNKMLKPGGYLIIDTSFTFGDREVKGEYPTPEELITKTKLPRPRPSLEVKTIDDTSVDIQVKTIVEAVYRSHTQVPTSYEYILQKKPMEGGQRRRCSRRCSRGCSRGCSRRNKQRRSIRKCRA